MRASRRCREKFLAAVRALAVREGDVRERLRGAHFHLRTLSPDDVPESVREDFEWILRSLTQKGPELGPDGEVYKNAIDNTLDQARNVTGRRIAERVFALFWSFDR